MKHGKRPVVLCICDGWGYSADGFGNAIAQARTPVFDGLWARWPHTLVTASGPAVGLPQGQQGNSEVGHLTMGAGRCISQPLERINEAVRDGSVYANPVLTSLVSGVVQRGGALHCLGLVSPGGVHSHQKHGVAMAELARRHGLERVYFHAFTDGRDEPPRSAAGFVSEFIAALEGVGVGSVASLSGRYYAMDRDRRWDRTARAYAALTGSGPLAAVDPVSYIEQRYTAGIGDEFIEPVRFNDSVRIQAGDGVIFWNFRPDRGRQLSHALVDPDFKEFYRGRRIENLDLVTMTEYDRDLDARVAYPREDVLDTLGEVVARAGLRQFHVAETEKYAHVTYFINGGREQPFAGEDRLLIPSSKVATYDLEPRMRAREVTAAAVEHLRAGDEALVILNLANCDMVGHSGIFDATVEAVEYTDECLGRIVDAALARDGAVLMTADHGNAEQKIDPRDNSPLTAHTLNPVPVLLCGSDLESLRDGGGLRDVAPTVLEVMGLEVPEAMTGRSLAKIATPDAVL